MILYNFILSFTLNKNFRENDILMYKHNTSIVKNIHSQKYSVLVVSRIQDKEEDYNLPFNKFVYPNVWQKFSNKYLQETVFLSPANKVDNSYINLLKKKGLSIYDSNAYRAFVNKFSKDLIKGKINVKYDDNLTKILNYKNFIYLKYSWSKILHFPILKFISFKNNIVSFLLRDKTVMYNNSIPLFVLVNDSNEIVMSESVNQLANLKHLSTFYENFIPNLFSNTYSNKFYTCLMFINYNDAIEYRDFLKYKNLISTNSRNVKIVPSNLRLYSNLKSLFAHSVDFRLIPDLKEVSNLIHKYSKFYNISFDQNQKYGGNFFQGQPLYKIKDLNFKNVKNKSLLDKNAYFFTNSNKYNNWNTLFLNYSTVEDAWKSFREQNKNIKLPRKPQVSISNLEFFIKKSEKEKVISEIIFLPSLETYKFVKEYFLVNLKNQSNFSYWLSNKSVILRTTCCRIFWSLISRQPNSV